MRVCAADITAGVSRHFLIDGGSRPRLPTSPSASGAVAVSREMAQIARLRDPNRRKRTPRRPLMPLARLGPVMGCARPAGVSNVIHNHGPTDIGPEE